MEDAATGGLSCSKQPGAQHGRAAGATNTRSWDAYCCVKLVLEASAELNGTRLHMFLPSRARVLARLRATGHARNGQRCPWKLAMAALRAAGVVSSRAHGPAAFRGGVSDAELARRLRAHFGSTSADARGAPAGESDTTSQDACPTLRKRGRKATRTQRAPCL